MNHSVHSTINPQFHQHLQCNDLPGRGVLEEAARSKVQLLADLQILDDEIQALQQRRLELANYRHVCASFVDDTAHTSSVQLFTESTVRTSSHKVREPSFFPISLSPGTPGIPHEHRDSTAPGQIRATLDLIARYADRISRLDVEISAYILHELGRAITEHFDFKCLPRLQQLRISSDHAATILPTNLHGPGEMPTLNAEIFKMFVGGESLRELSLRGLGSGRDINNVLIHASANITTLLVHEPINVSAAWSALSQLHRLERCHLNIFGSAGSSWSPSGAAVPITRFTSDAIVLPVLNMLSINSTLPSIESLLEILKTPSLSDLHLHFPSDTRLLGQFNIPSDMTTNSALLDYPPDSTQQLCAFLAQCKSLRSLTFTSHRMQAAEMQSILSVVPHVEHLSFHLTQTARVGSQVLFEPSLTLPMVERFLDPLLRQQRVLLDADSSNGEAIIHLDTPLLPCLQSLEWNTSSDTTLNDNFVAFVNNRLFKSPKGISAGGPVTASGGSRLDTPPQASTASLKNIKIRAQSVSDANDIERMIIRHAESVGLTRGVDFQLDVAPWPSVASAIPGGPRYVIPPGFSRYKPVIISEDGLFIERDVTWPWIEFGDLPLVGLRVFW
ncbi:hypothetical protein BJ165DRAFT_1595497 [Panaeolus papilionaceus]|nr:hypothetical protein BJ165DRAFT_1595497 [Panaeolus papilionaceus]